MNHPALPAHDTLLLTNARFYEAWETGDLTAMMQIWSRRDEVRCVHPGGIPQRGRREVEEGWGEMVAGNTNMRFSLRNVEAAVFGEIGLVTLIEEVSVRDGRLGATVSVAASNFFLFEEGAWRMIHHHGGLVATDEQQAGFSPN